MVWVPLAPRFSNGQHRTRCPPHARQIPTSLRSSTHSTASRKMLTGKLHISTSILPPSGAARNTINTLDVVARRDNVMGRSSGLAHNDEIQSSQLPPPRRSIDLFKIYNVYPKRSRHNPGRHSAGLVLLLRTATLLSVPNVKVTPK